jgi:hypothetical protein
VFTNTVELNIDFASSIPNINDNKRIDSTKMTIIPISLRRIPAFIKSAILTLLFANIIAFGGVAIKQN